MSTPARFSDGQYKNWLKCSHSLIIMKEALHDYIDDEVNKLHRDIMLKVSRIPCGSSTGNQCGSCSWKNIKLMGGNPRIWSINCKNSICDKWLHEIIAVHDDPHNPTINWKNADISKWPIDGYHVAKIFMPKGQDKTTKMPDELDAPAILSLMKYCNWFRKDLPNTQILSDLIVIRNTVLHSGDLKIADSYKDSCIDLMIQLLIDLNIPGDSQAELQMFKREDIDIDFRATEMRVFQRMVHDLESELTTLKEDMISLHDFQSELSKEMTRLRDNTETTTKVDTIETDVKEMRQSLHELRNISDKMVTFLDKNPDILDIKVTETIRNVSRDVEDQQRNLLRVEKELAARLSALEVKVENIQEETKKQFEGVERGLDAIKEQLTLQNSEYPENKRRETDGLKQLKSDKTSSFHCNMGQTVSKASGEFANIYKEVDNYQRNKERRIILIGKTGTGKSTLGNAILGYKCFKNEGVLMQSNTTHCQVGRGTILEGKDIVVLDTPGLKDTKQNRKEIIEELCKCIAIMAPGPHVICLVIRGDDRFTQENIDTLDEFCAFFGENIYQYVIVVFTHKASMGKRTTTDDCLSALPKEFRTKFLKFGGKKIAIESTAAKKEIKKQIKELIKLIEEIVERNGGGYYTEDTFKAAEEAFRKRIPKIQQEVDKLFEEKKRLLHDEYQDKAKRFEEREHELEKKLQKAKKTFQQEKQLKKKMKLEKDARAEQMKKLEAKYQEKMKSLEENLEKERAKKQKFQDEHERNMHKVNVKSVQMLQDTIIDYRSKARQAATESNGFAELARDVVKEGAGIAFAVVTFGIGIVVGGIANLFRF